jgi:hypothetical protein
MITMPVMRGLPKSTMKKMIKYQPASLMPLFTAKGETTHSITLTDTKQLTKPI